MCLYKHIHHVQHVKFGQVVKELHQHQTFDLKLCNPNPNAMWHIALYAHIVKVQVGPEL